jgi:hypothetical protein
MATVKFINITALLIVILFSCKKDEVSAPVFSEARYSIEITGKWKAPEFVVPGGVHFTTVLGMVHSSETYLWKPGTKASLGVENVAEAGNAYPLLYEIDTAIATGKSIALIAITAPLPTGSSKVNVYCTSNYSYISLETMLAPTPDWFTGINGFNLFENKRWVTDTTINLYAYDAGTEDGDVFGYNNPSTMPQQNVQLLTPLNASVLANGNSVLAPIATVRFTKK